jgi:adenosine/AMP kinase
MDDQFSLKLVTLDNQADYNLILAQSHFIKTVEDVHEMLVSSVPGAKFGLAFNEASGPCLIRKSGTDDLLIDQAVKLAKIIGSGHLLVIVMKEMYPINILPALKNVPEIVNVYCATANPVQLIVAQTNQGRGILGVIDGSEPKGIETNKEVQKRIDFLRQIGYKQR